MGMLVRRGVVEQCKSMSGLEAKSGITRCVAGEKI